VAKLQLFPFHFEQAMSATSGALVISSQNAVVPSSIRASLAPQPQTSVLLSLLPGYEHECDVLYAQRQTHIISKTYVI
jgi:hypothetical protein